MGRLQKKKSTAEKKKKKSASKSPDLSSPKQSSGRNSAVTASAVRGLGRRAASSKKKVPTKAQPGKGSKRKNYPEIALQFLREVMMELKKVTWPSRKQTTGSTVVMIILVTIFSIFLGTVDIGLSKFIQVILQ